VEYGEKVTEKELPGLAREIEEAMHQKLKIRPEISFVAPMSLARSTYKTRFIEKAYEKK
jgi:phenylacetate-CoA ligase